MGMSAGQARLLSITGRLTDNELRSQIITNSKLRLASKSSDASSEYMDALSSEQLMFSSYDANGAKSYDSLTAGTMLTFGELKNQYSLVNSSGQIMVSGSDIKKYVAANSMAEFLYSYGVEKVDNPKFSEKLTDIYGSSFEELFDVDAYEADTSKPNAYKYIWDNTINKITKTGIGTLEGILAKNSADITEDDAGQFSSIVDGWNNAINGTNGTGGLEAIVGLGGSEALTGSFGAYINKLLDLPKVTFPNKDDSQFKDVSGNSELAQKFDLASKKCYQNATGPLKSAGCYIHVLAHLLDLKSSDLNSAGDVSDSWGQTYTTTTGNGTIDTNGEINGSAINSNNQSAAMAEVSEYICNPANDCMAAYDETDTTKVDSSELDKLLSNFKFVDGKKTLKTFKEKVIDLYYVVENRSSLGIAYDDLIPYLDQFQTDMSTTLNSKFNEERYLAAVDDWKNAMQTWLKQVQNCKEEYVKDLENIPSQYVPDENDSKYQWYKNLWYRMGGIDETQSDKSGNNFKELDENLMNNSEWLQFALEHGVLTLEQVTFSENGSNTYPNIGYYDWKSIAYTSASDISSQEDEVAIARAEVKYQNAMREIQNEDKKFDQDLKKLDTEHSALQTEYESVKSVIDKNVERSFKAFS